MAEKLTTSLRETLKLIINISKEWEEIITNCQKSAKALETFAEQLRCCNQCKPGTIELFNKFPDLKQRLEENIKSCICDNLTTIVSQVQKLDSLNQRLRNSSRLTIKVYNDNWKTIDSNVIVEGSATRPSLAKLIEWIDDISNYYNYEYVAIKQSVELFDLQSENAAKTIHIVFEKNRSFPGLNFIFAQINGFVD